MNLQFILGNDQTKIFFAEPNQDFFAKPNQTSDFFPNQT